MANKVFREIFLEGALELARRGDIESARGFVQIVRASDRRAVERMGRKKGECVAARQVPADLVAECDAVQATFADGTPATDAGDRCPQCGSLESGCDLCQPDGGYGETEEGSDRADRMLQAAEVQTWADGSPVTEADRAEAVTLCQGCLSAPARWAEGSWWDCSNCAERVRLDAPDYRGH